MEITAVLNQLVADKDITRATYTTMPVVENVEVKTGDTATTSLHSKAEIVEINISNVSYSPQCPDKTIQFFFQLERTIREKKDHLS